MVLVSVLFLSPMNFSPPTPLLQSWDSNPEFHVCKRSISEPHPQLHLFLLTCTVSVFLACVSPSGIHAWSEQIQTHLLFSTPTPKLSGHSWVYIRVYMIVVLPSIAVISKVRLERRENGLDRRTPEYQEHFRDGMRKESRCACVCARECVCNIHFMGDSCGEWSFL